MALTQVSTGGVKDGTILNADVNAAAAIAGTKISPDFGSQNIATTGQLQATSSIPAFFKNAVTGTTPAYVLIGNNTQIYAFQASSSGFSINDYTNVNVARLSIDSSGNSKVHGDLTIQSNFPRIFLTDNDTNPDYSISNANGKFAVYDETNSADRFSINSSGNSTIHNDLTVSGNLAVTTQSQFNNAVTINSGLFVGGSSVSGGEGGQIELTQAPTSTLAGSNVVFDTVVNSIRFFESASPFKGAFLDLSTCGASVSSQIMTSSTAVTYTGAMIFGSGASINLSTNDVYLNARVINNQTGGTDDGLYIGYDNANSGTTKIFGGGSSTHHFTFGATNFYPGTDSHSSLGTSANTWLNLFADTVNVTGPGSTTLKLTTAAGAVDVVSLDTSHASATKPQMHFKLQGTSAFTIDQNHNINMGGSLTANAGGRFFDIYNLGTDTNSYAIARLITYQQGSTNTTTGEIIKYRNGDMSIRNNEPSGFCNINFYTATSAGSHEAARFISDKGFLCSRNTPGDQGLVDPGVIFDRADSRVGTNFNTFNGVGIIKDSNTWATALYIMRTEAGCGQGYFIEFAFRTTAGAQNTIGRIENNGATNVLYTTYSDYRLKQDIAPITDAISRIKTLKPIKFRWKDDLEMGYQDGFIAHEVEETNDFKYLISGKKDATRKKYDNPEETEPDYQGIDYAKFTPILISALQEAVAKIETLETKVAALEAS